MRNVNGQVAKILIIDDDKTMSHLLTTLLRIEKYEVSGQVDIQYDLIIQQVLNLQPDIIIMDIHLHGINGLEIVKSLKDNKATSEAKIIVSSGDNQVEQARKAGADIFFLKPYMPADLLTCIRNLLQPIGDEIAK